MSLLQTHVDRLLTAYTLVATPTMHAHPPTRTHTHAHARTQGLYVTVDGYRLFYNDWANAREIVFLDSARVLGVKGRDFECGCRCGFLKMACTAENRNSKWHNFRSAASDTRIRAIASLSREFGRNDYKGDTSDWGMGSTSKPLEDWSKPSFA